MLAVGDRAPDFTTTDQTGAAVTLDDLVRGGVLILYFYPRDFTPVCTAQACTFRDAESELAAEGARVVGVSGDSGDSHSAFSAKHGVRFPLLSDPDKTLQKAFGARQLLGLLAKRVTYVIDQHKTVRGVFHHELSAEKHLEAVRKVLKSLG